MASELTISSINAIEIGILDTMELYGIEGDEATKLLTYIAGIHDMANAVKDVIKKLEGNDG